MTPVLPTEALLDELKTIARRAGEAVMEVYAGEWNLREKADSSPVTQADVLAEAIIVARLQQLTPDIPIVAEEAVAAGRIPALADRFWLVDPLDGTREFIQRNGEFTVNIALIDKGRPVLGVVYAPVQGRLFSGDTSFGAWCDTEDGGHAAIRCRVPPAQGLTVLASRSHGDARELANPLANLKVDQILHIGSSLKFGLIACGEGDFYPRYGPTMEWDIAAGHAVLAAAGGELVDLAGNPMTYGKPEFRNPGFIAFGEASPHVRGFANPHGFRYKPE